jgi:hypothetical protein
LIISPFNPILITLIVCKKEKFKCLVNFSCTHWVYSSTDLTFTLPFLLEQLRPKKLSLNSASMSSTSFSPSTQLFQDFLKNFPSRKLLQQALFSQPPMLPSPSPSGGTIHPPSELYTSHRYVPNIVLVILLVLCAIIGSLALFTIIKNVLECSSLIASEYNGNLAARLANYTARIELISLKTFSTGHTQGK